MTENAWSKEFPTEPGYYWFYSYRYGKISCGRETEPELMLARVHKVSSGVIIVADGQHVFKSETECAHFKKAELPELPDLET